MQVSLPFTHQLVTIFTFCSNISDVAVLECTTDNGIRMWGVDKALSAFYQVKTEGASYTCKQPVLLEFYPRELLDLLRRLTTGDSIDILATESKIEVVVHKDTDSPCTVVLTKANQGEAALCITVPDLAPLRSLTFPAKLLNYCFDLHKHLDTVQLRVDNDGLWIEDMIVPLVPLSETKSERSTTVLESRYCTNHLICSMIPVCEVVQLNFHSTTAGGDNLILSAIYDDVEHGVFMQIANCFEVL